MEGKGNTIRIYQDGNLVLEYNDLAPILNGKIGVGCYSQPAWYDNATVYSISAIQAIPRSVNGVVKRANDGILYDRVTLAMFNNEQGLKYTQYGSTIFDETTASGNAILTLQDQNGAGRVLGYALESSNVSLTQEISTLSLAQKLFAAVSKIFQIYSTNADCVINLIR